MPVYPNRERALRHIKRTRAVCLYGRFPQRYILGCGLPPTMRLHVDVATKGGEAFRDLFQKITRAGRP